MKTSHKSFLMLSLAVVASVAAVANEASWKSDVATGSYTDDANWSAGLPRLSKRATFDFLSSTGEITGYTVTFPADVTNDTSSTFVTGLRDGQSLTFDSTLGPWYKGPGVMTLAEYPLYMSTGGLSSNADFLRFNNGAVGNGIPAFMMSNALLEVSYSADSGSLVDFKQGLWNWKDPCGLETVNAVGLYFGRADTNAVLKIREGTCLRGREFRIFGGTVDIEGGDHSFASTLHIGGNSQAYASRTPVLNVSGGTVGLDANMNIGGTGCTGLLKAAVNLSGDAEMTLSGQYAVNVGSSAASSAELAMCGQAYLTNWIMRVGGDGSAAVTGIVSLSDAAAVDCARLLVAPKAGSRGDVIMSGSSKITVGGHGTAAMYPVEIGCGAGATGKVSVAGNAMFVSNPGDKRYVKVGGDASGYGEISFAGQSCGSFGYMYLGFPGRYRLSLADSACVTVTLFNASWSSPSTGTVHIAGNSRLYSSGLAQLGCHGHAEVVLSGNASFGVKSYLFVGRNLDGSCDMLVKDSALLDADSYIWIGDATINKTTLRVQDQATVESAQYVMLKGANTLLDLAGGSFSTSSGDYVSTVCGTTGVYNCIKVSGGNHSIAGKKGLKVLDESTAAGAVGCLELEGGRLSVRKAYGGEGAAANGGGGSAVLRGNGGTLAALADGETLVADFDTAELGAAGLAVEVPRDMSVSVDQVFTDATGAAGKLTKTGDGILIAKADSSHAVTRVENGTLAFGSGVTRFGRRIVVAGGAVDAMSRNISVDGLDLGGTLHVDSSTVISVANASDFTVANGVLKFADSPAAGDYAGIFRISGEVDDDAFDGLVVVDPDGYNRYSFATASSDGVTTVTMTVTDASSCEDAEWSGGASSAWSADANWSGGEVPDAGMNAVFPASAGNKSVEIGSPAQASVLEFGAGEWSLFGGGLLSTYGIYLTAGAHVAVSAPITPRGVFIIDAEEGSSVDLSSAFGRMAAGELRKTGSGLVTLSGARDTAGTGWSVIGGTMRAESGDALGSSSVSVTLGPATLSITNDARFAGDIVCDNGENALVATLDVVGDVAVTGSLSVVGGGFAKTGSGRLSVKYPEGDFTVGANDVGFVRNIAPANSPYSGVAVLPATGDSPTGDAVKCFGAFNVMDGAVSLRGEGAEVTKLVQPNWTVIGLNNPALTADAELRLSALTWEDTGDFRRFVVGARNYGTETLVRPRLLIDDGAFVTAQGLFLGLLYNRHTYPTLAITNATLEVESQIYIGAGNTYSPNAHPSLRIGEGGVIRSRGTNANRAYGVMIGQNVDIDVDGGLFDTSAEPNGVMLGFTACGRMAFRNGGRLSTAGFIANNNRHQDVTNLVMSFDGGVLEINAKALASSEISAPEDRCMITEGDGMEISIGAGLAHVLRFPLTGEGKVVKTGGGTFAFGTARDVKFSFSVNNAVSTTNDSDVAVAQWTGETEVRAGTLKLLVPSVATTNITVSSGAVLDLGNGTVSVPRLSGSGTVTNGSLDSPTLCAGDVGLLFEGVAFSGRVKVDFGMGSEPPAIGSVRAVARFAQGSLPDVSTWRGINCGRNFRASFEVDAQGNVTAGFSPVGSVIVIR